MAIDLSRTSGNRSILKKDKKNTIGVDKQGKQKIVCPGCQGERFEGFTNYYGAFRRCLDCRYEWAAGGRASIAMLDKEEKEGLKTFLSALDEGGENSLAKMIADAEDQERLDEVRMREFHSPKNRTFIRNYGNEEYP